MSVRSLELLPDAFTLPPQQFRLLNPRIDKIDTPLIPDLGLVDIDQLIEDVKLTVHPSYIWSLDRKTSDIHHFYWQGDLYPYDEFGVVNPARFRNLAVHKGELPRIFHNWLHVITIPPPVPSEEVMFFRTEGWLVANHLFDATREAIGWEKKRRQRQEQVAASPGILRPEFEGIDVIGIEIIRGALERHFDKVELFLDQSEQIPPEFRIIDPDEVSDLYQLATLLGSRTQKERNLIPALANS